MKTKTTKETLGFQTEVKQLLKLMIHSLYSNKEIFLRELISNASDAADKLRFAALIDVSLLESDSELKIGVSFDRDKRTITVCDNGIGMSRQEVVEHIGTIAKSGTREFFDSLTGDQAKDAHLIGKFGVGFYSSFIVAEKVEVITRRAGLGPEHGVYWESSGEGEYSIETVIKDKPGTEVILHLRKEEDELLEDLRLKTIIRKYSDHITLPIIMKKMDKDEEETVNQANALWARPKSEVTQEQYEEFYKHVAHAFEAPLCYTHSKVEGRQEYTQLLYIPSRAPFDLWDREHSHGIKLYVRRVFIMDDAEKFMPCYLRFVRGVIDSNNLPLNVSREILQDSKDVEAIRAGSVKKVLAMIEDLAENNQEKFKIFWTEFGCVLKEGVGQDFTNLERISKLLRFASTYSDIEAQNVSLCAYIARMKLGQEKIYYVTGETFNAAKNSPQLEIFRKKGIEVLLLHERVDEWMMTQLTEFSGKKMQSVAKGDLDLGQLEDADEKKEAEKQTDEHKDFLAKIKDALGGKAKDVRITHRLTSSPACVVKDQHDMSVNLERMLKSMGQAIPSSKPILEINLQHPIVQHLKCEDAKFADWGHFLFDQALLAEGGELEDPAGFVKRLNELVLSLTSK